MDIHKKIITKTRNGFVGDVIVNEEIVFTTPVREDSSIVSAELIDYIKKLIKDNEKD